MELPFEIMYVLRKIQAEPGILVAFASFHPLAIFLLSIPMWILKKIGIKFPKLNLGFFGIGIVFVISVGWILGFVSQILLLFMGVSGLKMLLIYLAMYFCIIAYFISNAKGLSKNFDEFSAKQSK